MPSLRKKVVYGVYTLAAAIAAAAAFAGFDLWLMERRVTAEVTVSRFADAVLEVRRYEKNYFLYGRPEDFQAAREFRDQATAILRDERQALDTLNAGREIAAISEKLTNYSKLLDAALPAPDGSAIKPETKSAIRAAGHQLAEGTQALADNARAHLARSLSRARAQFLAAFGILAVAGILIAHWLASVVAKPLARLESRLRAIGSGHFDHVEPETRDREIVAIANATNRMLTEIEARRRQLLQTEKLASLGTLVSGVAHELNNPLSNISTSCQLALEELPPGASSELREWLTQADTETERARRIVRTLLEFSRTQDFAPAPIRLHHIASSALSLIAAKIRARGTVSLDMPESLTVHADAARLQQVFVNLIGNALDSAPVPVHIHITARRVAGARLHTPPAEFLYARAPCPTAESQGAVEILIEDDGLGIAEANLPRVFDPFFTTKDVGHGSGLGLYVTQEIIQEHRGCIGVSSSAGRGSRFLIVLPDPEKLV
jgi:signal transduction histidine kinase